MSHSASKTCVNALQAHPRYAHATEILTGILTLSLSVAYIPIASPTEGRFREASQGGTNRGEGPEMRHKTFSLGAGEPDESPESRPVRPPRAQASLACAPGRFRGSARAALRPRCEELAGLGQDANVHDPGSAARD